MFHKWTDHVYSLDIKNLPDFVKEEYDYTAISDKPVSLFKDGTLVINESEPNWIAIKNLLFSLDCLPQSLLEDLYKTESERYKNMEPNIDTDDVGEAIRRILYFSYIPYVLKSHKMSGKKHF